MFGVLIFILLFSALSVLYARRLLVWFRNHKRITKKMDAFVAEPMIPFLGHTLQLPTDIYDSTDYMVDIANKYAAKGARAFRLSIGNDHYVIPLDGATLKDMVDSSVEITKGHDYDFLIPWLGTGLLISTDNKWRSRRKMLTPTFHFRMLDSYQESFNQHAKKLVSFLDGFVEGEKVDLFPYVKNCALDIICETAMGVTVNALSNHDHSYVKAVHEMAYLQFIYGNAPWYQIKPIFYALGYGQRRDKAVDILTGFTRKVIAERKVSRKADQKESKEGRKAFLDMLLDLTEESKLNDEDIREEVDTFMFEGHDTTSSGIAYTLWCLACHPEHQDRVAAELFGIFGTLDLDVFQNASGDSNRDVTKEDLQAMPYLEMCIKEAMRLYPPVPMVSREMVHGDLQLGQKFAMNEEKTLVSWILRRFQLEPTMPFQANRPGIIAILTPQHGVPVRLSRRSL